MMRSILKITAAVIPLAASCILRPAAAQPSFAITDLGTLGGSSGRVGSNAFGLNIGGQVVGGSYLPNGTGRAFLWTPDFPNATTGAIAVLPNAPAFPATAPSVANGINAAGAAAGDIQDSGGHHAILWEPPDYFPQDLGVLAPGAEASAQAINNIDEPLLAVVGYSRTGPYPNPRHGFFWNRQNGMKDLGTLGGPESFANGVNDANQIAGTSLTAAGLTHAVRWDSPQPAAIRDLGTLGGTFSSGSGIGVNGEVVGVSTTGSGVSHAFLWRDTVGMTDLTASALGPSTSSTAYSINSFGQVVGYAEYYFGYHFAFLYDSGTVYDLNDLIPPDSGWRVLLRAWAINDAGQIIGDGYINDQVHAFLLTPQ